MPTKSSPSSFLRCAEGLYRQLDRGSLPAAIIRDQEESSLSLRSFANCGTDFLVPTIANCLQAIAFSAAGLVFNVSIKVCLRGRPQIGSECKAPGCEKNCDRRNRDALFGLCDGRHGY